MKKTISFVVSVVGISITLVFFGLTTVHASPVREFNAAITPTSSPTLVTKSYTATYTNSASSTKEIKSATLAVPAGFTVTSSTLTLGGDASPGWLVALNSGLARIEMSKSSGGSDINHGHSFTLTFTAQAPSSAGIYTWTARAFENNSFGSGGGGEFTIISSQPTVIVISPPTENTLALCSNGSDDDGDGLIDLADPDCASFQPKITVIKTVVNNNGGTAEAGDFPLFIDETSVQNGQQNGFNVGSHLVHETNQPGYSASFSGDCDENGNVTLGIGDVKSCTITNDDIAAKLTVIKVVINNNDGEAGVDDFPLFIDDTPVISGVQNNFNAGSHTITETNQSNYTGTFSGDCDAQGVVLLAVGDVKTCTITNDDNPPPPPVPATLIVFKNVVNDNGGTKQSGDFTITVSGTNVSQGSFPGNASGTTITLDAGQYTVDELAMTAYTKSLGADCSGTINAGETKTCIITNDDIQPQLIVTKKVINDNGGTKTALDFTIIVNANNANPTTFPGSASGTTVLLNAGVYSVTEQDVFGYASSTSDEEDCSGIIAIGQTRTCTIINNDIQPKLIVIKHVINDNSGMKTASDFIMQITGINVSSATFPGSESGVTVMLDAGAYAVNEDLMNDYGKILGSDCSGTLAVGETKTCIITNDDTAPTPPPSSGSGPVSGAGPNGGLPYGSGVSTAPPAPTGQVLGATISCEPYLSTYLKFGGNNDPSEVKKLQEFLNQQGFPVSVTGIFGKLTHEAVIAFQKKFGKEILAPWIPFGLKSAQDATGYVYKTTQRWINMLQCSSLNLPMPTLP